MPASELSGQLFGRSRPPRAGGVRARLLGKVEQRIQNPPGLLDRVLAGEVALVSLHGRVEQLLVGSWDALTIAAEVDVQIDRPQSRPVGSLCMQHPARARSRVDQ